jgi:membrane protein
VSLTIATVLFAMIYKLMPSTNIAWRDVWVGAFTTAALFEVGKMLISLYIGKSGMTESFAAAGSLVVLLAWVYYAAQIFLLGAEFTKVHADENGSRMAAKALAQTAQTAAVGMHTEVPVSQSQPLQEPPSALAPGAGFAKPSPAMRAADAGLNAALSRLFTEIVALAVLSVAGSVMARKRKSLEKKISLQKKIRWGRRAH